MATTRTEGCAYAHGNGIALVAPTSVVLLGPSVAVDVEAMWRAVRRAEPLDAIVDVLLASGVRNLPSFACAALQPGGVVILSRGAATVRVLDPEGSVVEITSPEVLTWEERRVQRGSLVDLEIEGLEAPTGTRWWVERAVVPAAAVYGWSDQGSDPSGSHQPMVRTPGSVQGGAESAVDHGKEATARSAMPGTGRAGATPSGPSHPLGVEAAAVRDDTEGDEEDELVAVEGDDLPAAPTPTGTARHDPPADPSATLPPPDTAHVRRTLIDHVPWLLQNGSPPAEPARERRSQPVDVDAMRHVEAEADRRDADDEGGDDGATISSVALERLREEECSRQAGPLVEAIRCPAGHGNPLTADACRTCGAAIFDRSVTEVRRPVLGLLEFDTGQVVPLSGPLLIGRRPTRGSGWDGEQVETVTLPDPERALSRNHLEVRLEGWQVLVVDRASRNGSTVEAPGVPPVALTPGEAQPIAPGTVVRLADVASFRYEAASG